MCAAVIGAGVVQCTAGIGGQRCVVRCVRGHIQRYRGGRRLVGRHIGQAAHGHGIAQQTAQGQQQHHEQGQEAAHR